MALPWLHRQSAVIDVEARCTRQRSYSQFTPVLCPCFWIFNRAKRSLFSCLDTVQRKTVVQLFPRILLPSSTTAKSLPLHFRFRLVHLGFKAQQRRWHVFITWHIKCLLQMLNVRLLFVYLNTIAILIQITDWRTFLDAFITAWLD